MKRQPVRRLYRTQIHNFGLTRRSRLTRNIGTHVHSPDLQSIGSLNLNTMRLRTGLAFQIGQLAHAEPTHHFWGGPDPTGLELYRRQDGYNPELGTCGVGLTCAAACGDGFEACSAKETSILFCFNPGAGQTCCPGGSGREYSPRQRLYHLTSDEPTLLGACDAGFYCVNDPNGGQTYCCDEVCLFVSRDHRYGLLVSRCKMPTV